MEMTLRHRRERPCSEKSETLPSSPPYNRYQLTGFHNAAEPNEWIVHERRTSAIKLNASGCGSVMVTNSWHYRTAHSSPNASEDPPCTEVDVL
ncbi:hypothetical protein TNCV_4394261 [Trichonephila clavipes]|uniref:Uncharacterized protein n=1 Tax=Trichonephila clavipes TaxID=2585209 RepID=A0A8X6W4Y4_TRICX|nr:hypothetical protein TNCV_4394261 [Trichonephila clavipes]